MTCPHCNAELTEDQVKSLYAAMTSARRGAKKGWPKGMKRKPPTMTGTPRIVLIRDPTCALCDEGDENHEH